MCAYTEWFSFSIELAIASDATRQPVGLRVDKVNFDPLI